MSLGLCALAEHGNLQETRKDVFGNDTFAVEIVEHIGEITDRKIISSAQTLNQSFQSLA